MWLGFSFVSQISHVEFKQTHHQLQLSKLCILFELSFCACNWYFWVFSISYPKNTVKTLLAIVFFFCNAAVDWYCILFLCVRVLNTFHFVRIFSVTPQIWKILFIFTAHTPPLQLKFEIIELVCVPISRFKKKSRSLWLVIMDDNAPTHKRRKLVKNYKNVLLQKRIVVAGRPTPKMIKRWSRKTDTNVKITPQIKGECRERERYGFPFPSISLLLNRLEIRLMNLI